MHASSMKIKDGHTFEINLNVNFNTATIEVEDVETHEKWETTFDANFVEELARKVGNYKKFPVFISMLESAIKEKSSSVSIELLNYSEIELLKNKKMGLHLMQSSAYALNSRKLIMILNHIDEFDRTKYPLALNYLGVLDIKLLQNKLKKLQLELATYRNQDTNCGESRQILILKKEVEKLKREKCEIEVAFKEFKETLDERDARPKESKKLMNLINIMEGDLANEMMKHKNDLRKKVLENKTLTAEINKLKTSEQRLRTQVQNLKNEVAQLKRSKASSSHNRTSSRSPLAERSRDSSRESKFSGRSWKGQQTFTNRQSRCLTSDFSPSRKVRSLSNELPKRSFTCPRKPSPSGSLGSRFDPTAYVSEMRRKRLEIQRRRESSLESRRNNIPSNQKWRGGHQSSSESCVSFSSDHRRSRVASKKFENSAKDESESSSLETTEPAMSDVDLRLARLKRFLKELQ